MKYLQTDGDNTYILTKLRRTLNSQLAYTFTKYTAKKLGDSLDNKLLWKLLLKMQFRNSLL